MKTGKITALVLSGMVAISILGMSLPVSALTVSVQSTTEQTEDYNTPYNKYVDIPDQNLRKILNTRYFKQTENAPITQYQLRTLRGTLYLGSSNISDLTGLEYCVGITGLYLSYNNISDISPLKKLTNLKTLNITNQKVKADDVVTTNGAAIVNNVLVGISGENIAPTNSNQYSYNKATNQLTFNNIVETGEKSYTFKQKFTYGRSKYTTYFSGTVTQQVIK